MSKPSYLNPTSESTLREALAELNALEANVTADVVSSTLAAALTAHDAVHVLFGCDITNHDEVLAHVWMLVGTDAAIKDLHRITQDDNHVRYAEGFAHGRRMLTVLAALPSILRVVMHARRMTKKWPFAQYDQYLDARLLDLRREFGIHIVSSRTTSNRGRGPHHPPATSEPLGLT